MVKFLDLLTGKCSLENYSKKMDSQLESQVLPKAWRLFLKASETVNHIFFINTYWNSSLIFKNKYLHIRTDETKKLSQILQTLSISGSKVNREVSLGNFGSIIFKESSALRVHNLSPLRISYLDRFLKTSNG